MVKVYKLKLLLTEDYIEHIINTNIEHITYAHIEHIIIANIDN